MAGRRLVWLLVVGPFDGGRCRAQRVLFRLMNDATTPPADSAGGTSPEETADAAADGSVIGESVVGESVTDDSIGEDTDTDAASSGDWFEHAVVVESPRPPRPPRSRKRVGIAVFAVALIVSGVGILTYVGWEYYGTNIVSKRAHERIDNRLDAIWRYPTVADLLGPGTAPSSGSATAVLRIPKFGTSYAVPIIEGVGASALAKGVGHFSGTGPGQIGNYALAGHRLTHGEPFARLNTLKSGDQVIVETDEATYTYVLDTAPRDLTVDFHQTWVVDAVPIAPKGGAPPGMPHLDPDSPTRALLTLATCSEIFHTDNRSIGFGHLVKTTAR
jgi:sortase A